MDERELVYDWNLTEWHSKPGPPRVEILDRTFEQASALDRLKPVSPTHGLRLASAMADLAIDDVCLGRLGPDRLEWTSLLEAPRPWLSATVDQVPTDPGDGLARLLLEADPRRHQLETVAVAVRTATTRGAEATLVVSDATAVSPELLGQLLLAAADAGATGICLSDDQGRAIAPGVRRLLEFAEQVLETGGHRVRLEWRGGNQQGLALSNALAAVTSGAHRIHSSFYGLGPGPGGVATDLLLVNAKLLGAMASPLEGLGRFSSELSECLGHSVLPNYPVLGEDAFRTGTGVHAAAILKADTKGHAWLADRVYSGVPASLFGFSQIIEVGPMAGASNVHHWLKTHGQEPTPDLVQRVLQRAKASSRVLTDQEILEAIG